MDIEACREDNYAKVVADLTRLHGALSALATLAPGPHTDAVFDELVALTVRPWDDRIVQRVLADPDVRRIIPSLRRLCSSGEIELERAWARRILASHAPCNELRKFPYFTNYELLTRIEFGTVQALAGGVPERVLFVGAGPLPLTSLLLAGQQAQAKIDNIDIDPEAALLAEELAHVLEVRNVSVQCTDILAHCDIGRYDLVCVAALVGSEPGDKARVLTHLYRHMRPGALLLLRGAHSLRTLLYPPVHLRDLAGFRPLVVLHPYNDVVNSLIVAEKPATAADDG